MATNDQASESPGSGSDASIQVKLGDKTTVVSTASEEEPTPTDTKFLKGHPVIETGGVIEAESGLISLANTVA